MTTARAEAGQPEDGSRGTWTLLVTAGLAAWFGATAASQHPHRLFDRFRDYDPTGLFVPNWRFFAPEPAQHDFHVLHRVLTADGEQTLWNQTSQIAPRALVQAAWFPGRRREKAIFDICNELIVHMGTPGLDVTRSPAYLMLRDSVELAVRTEFAGRKLPQGFQFLIARHTGHDEEHDPDYVLVSPFVPLEEAA
ncbi:MAG: hypothetical protein ACRDZO_03325 [Egibacteraceae bacterium]